MDCSVFDACNAGHILEEALFLILDKDFANVGWLNIC